VGEGQGHEDEHASEHEKGKDHHGPVWKYAGVYGPGNWSEQVPLCHSDSHRQSPINIVIKDTQLSELLDKITLSEPSHPGGNFSGSAIMAVNNGHTVGFKFNHVIEVLGGELNAFRVAGAHFHWGETDETGSEHLLDGQHFPLELHIVTYDQERYDGLMKAIHGYNSLAVLGIQYIISEEDNPALESIIDAVQKVQEPRAPVDVDDFDLSSLLPEHTDQYYRYEGSLTTPPCSQSVVWTVFKHPATISSAQLAHFRQLLEGPPEEDGTPDYISHNWRPVQPLHKRVVQRSFSLHDDHPQEIVKKVEEQKPTNPKAKEVKGKTGGATDSAKYSLYLLTSALLFLWS
jgi:carbonic anhydrase